MPDAQPSVTLADVEIGLAWNVRGDRGDSRFVSEAKRLLAVPVPHRPGTSTRGDGVALLSVGPTSWLYVTGPGRMRTDFDDARKKLNQAGGALFDVSASHVGWIVSGASASQVLNKSCPLDLHPTSFAAGHCARSLLGHVDALLYRPAERPAFIVLVARSFATDVWTELCASASAGGYDLAPAMDFSDAVGTGRT